MATNQSNSVQVRSVPFNYGNYSENNAFYARINAKKEKDALKKAEKAVKKATKKAAKSMACTSSVAELPAPVVNMRPAVAPMPAVDRAALVAKADAILAEVDTEAADRVEARMETSLAVSGFNPEGLWREALASGDVSKCEQFAHWAAHAAVEAMLAEGAFPAEKAGEIEERLYDFYGSAVHAEIAEKGTGEAILTNGDNVTRIISEVCGIAGMSESDTQVAAGLAKERAAKAATRRTGKKATVAELMPSNTAMADALARAQAAKK